MAELVAIAYSPWSERARWALDHHRVVYRETPYYPLMDEPWLRARLGEWRRRVSVPVFFDAGRAVADSFEIAKLAERQGRGESLFPKDAELEVLKWVDLSDRALDAGRIRLVPRIMSNRGALADALPSYIPSMARGALAPLSWTAAAYVTRKYGLRQRALADARDVIREAAGTLRAQLASGSPYLVANQLTFADIAMTAPLQMIQPVDDRFLPLASDTRKAWTDPELAGQLRDVLDWRDEIYAKHRSEP